MAVLPATFYQEEASRMTGPIYEIGRIKGRVSALLDKGVMPEGMGSNWITVTYDRSIPVGDNDWSEVQPDDGTGNTCVKAANTINPANTTRTFVAYTYALESKRMCMEDGRGAYEMTKQTVAARDNFMGNIVDTWEVKDTDIYVQNCDHKMICAPGFPEDSADFPSTTPTSRLTQGVLDYWYELLFQDDFQNQGAYAYRDAKPVFGVMMSMNQQRGIIKQSPEVRQDFRWADATEGMGATLMKAWGIDREYGGWFHIINNRMPRYRYSGGVYTRISFYIEAAGASKGVQAILNPEYINARYELVLFWHPLVVKRLMPRTLTTLGADTKFMPVDWSAAINWLNYQTDDNPLGNIGYWRADFKAAWEPHLQGYGYALIVQRCPSADLDFISCS